MIYNTLASPRVNDLEIITTTNTTITITWTPPSFAPETLCGTQYCLRLCEQSFAPSHSYCPITSPFTFTGINPGTFCIVDLNGVYGSDVRRLSISIRIGITHSSGKI